MKALLNQKKSGWIAFRERCIEFIAVLAFTLVCTVDWGSLL